MHRLKHANSTQKQYSLQFVAHLGELEYNMRGSVGMSMLPLMQMKTE